VVLEKSTSFYVWAIVVLMVTFFLEALGTATGKIFGPYTYGGTLAPKLLKVPVVIAFNWLLVILGALILARLITRRRVLAAFLGAAFAAGFDFLLELDRGGESREHPRAELRGLVPDRPGRRPALHLAPHPG
jgi:uncharacterized membrane protein